MSFPSRAGSRHRLYSWLGPTPSSRISTTSPNRTPDKQCVIPELVFRITQWKSVGLDWRSSNQASSWLSKLFLCFTTSFRNNWRKSSLCPLLRFPKSQSETPQAANMKGTTKTDAVVAHRGTEETTTTTSSACCCCCCCCCFFRLGCLDFSVPRGIVAVDLCWTHYYKFESHGDSQPSDRPFFATTRSLRRACTLAITTTTASVSRNSLRPWWRLWNSSCSFL